MALDYCSELLDLPLSALKQFFVFLYFHIINIPRFCKQTCRANDTIFKDILGKPLFSGKIKP